MIKIDSQKYEGFFLQTLRYKRFGVLIKSSQYKIKTTLSSYSGSFMEYEKKITKQKNILLHVLTIIIYDSQYK